MYDMYPWARGAEGVWGERVPPKSRGGLGGIVPPGLAEATHAVQVALDRRDNGGDTAAAAPDADAAGTPAEPTARPTRQ
jgi:hypothetical protein